MQNTTLPALPGMGAAQASVKSVSESIQVDVTKMPVAQLLELRAQIEAALPARSLKDIDLTKELVLQVLALQTAQHKALTDDEAPTNQIAQAMSALTAALTTLVKLQVETYTSERLKRIELVLISTLQELPMEAQHRFMDAYEAALESVS